MSRKKYSDVSFLQKCRACFSGLRSLETGGAWDVAPLAAAGHAEQSPVPAEPFGQQTGSGGGRYTVSYRGRCYHAHAVNYLLWGRANRLCHETFPVINPLAPTIFLFGLTTTTSLVTAHKTSMAALNLFSGHGWLAAGYLNGIPSATAFTVSGYTGINTGLSIFSLPISVESSPVYMGNFRTQWKWLHLQDQLEY